MEPQPTTSTTLHSFRLDDFGKIELGWGLSTAENPGHEGGIFQIRFIPGIPPPEKGDRVKDNFLTNAAGKMFQKAGDLTDRLLRILHREYRFQAVR